MEIYRVEGYYVWENGVVLPKVEPKFDGLTPSGDFLETLKEIGVQPIEYVRKNYTKPLFSINLPIEIVKPYYKNLNRIKSWEKFKEHDLEIIFWDNPAWYRIEDYYGYEDVEKLEKELPILVYRNPKVGRKPQTTTLKNYVDNLEGFNNLINYFKEKNIKLGLDIKLVSWIHKLLYGVPIYKANDYLRVITPDYPKKVFYEEYKYEGCDPDDWGGILMRAFFIIDTEYFTVYQLPLQLI